jgi:surfactin synthase thioesterase subunit
MPSSVTSATPWFTPPTAGNSARMRLFCFPYAGGGAALYRQWPRLLPATIELLPAHLPGRERRFQEPSFTQLPPLIEALAPAIVPYIDRPYAVFGHSMGALIAFELARELRRRGAHGPSHLFVSGHRAPHMPDRDRPVHALPPSEFMAELRRLQGTPPEVLEHPELMELMSPLLRADFELSETYSYTDDAPLDCPISVFGGSEDPKTNEEELEGWRAHTSNSFINRTYQGNHFFLQDYHREVARAVALDLSSALRVLV